MNCNIGFWEKTGFPSSERLSEFCNCTDGLNISYVGPSILTPRRFVMKDVCSENQSLCALCDVWDCDSISSSSTCPYTLKVIAAISLMAIGATLLLMASIFSTTFSGPHRLRFRRTFVRQMSLIPGCFMCAGAIIFMDSAYPGLGGVLLLFVMLAVGIPVSLLLSKWYATRKEEVRALPIEAFIGNPKITLRRDELKKFPVKDVMFISHKWYGDNPADADGKFEGWLVDLAKKTRCRALWVDAICVDIGNDEIRAILEVMIKCARMTFSKWGDQESLYRKSAWCSYELLNATGDTTNLDEIEVRNIADLPLLKDLVLNSLQRVQYTSKFKQVINLHRFMRRLEELERRGSQVGSNMLFDNVKE